MKPGILNRDVHLLSAKQIAIGLKDLGIMKGDPEEAVRRGAHALFFPHGLGHMMGLDVHDMENLGEDYVGYSESVQRSTQFGLTALRMARTLEPGFVITVEPGVYFIPALIDQWRSEGRNKEFIAYDIVEDYLDFGGVRIEDDVLVTKENNRVLGESIPKTVAEIEHACQA
jgi:Xaa-Pro aminopeptidase